MLFLLAMILVPFLFWRGTWFGRRLSEEETGRYLASTDQPRKMQHALVQVGERILRRDPSVERWYAQVEALASHLQPEVRSTVAWVMGQDNRVPAFHAALLRLLEDPEPLVRRNAALALVRFADPVSRSELRQMLLPYAVTAPAAGVLVPRLKPGDPTNPGTLLARIESSGGEESVDVRSPLPGELAEWLVAERGTVAAGEAVALLSPAEEQVWEALRALYLIGQPEELEAIEPFARGRSGFSPRIQQQAQLTADAIRRRHQELRDNQAGKTSEKF